MIEIVCPGQNVDDVSALHLEMFTVLFCPIDTRLDSSETLSFSADGLPSMLCFDASVY